MTLQITPKPPDPQAGSECPRGAFPNRPSVRSLGFSTRIFAPAPLAAEPQGQQHAAASLVEHPLSTRAGFYWGLDGGHGLFLFYFYFYFFIPLFQGFFPALSVRPVTWLAIAHNARAGEIVQPWPSFALSSLLRARPSPLPTADPSAGPSDRQHRMADQPGGSNRAGPWKASMEISLFSGSEIARIATTVVAQHLIRPAGRFSASSAP